MRQARRKILNQEQLDLNISELEDIQQSLLKGDNKAYCGIDDFQKLFQKKRLIGEALQEYHQKNKISKQNIAKVQQRLVQIEHLAELADKQSVLLKNQIERINDAHTMAKILTIERMIKAKMEHDELQKRKENIFRIRQQKHRASLANQSRKEYKTQKLRQLSLIESRNVRDYLNQKNYETIEVKRSRADQVREDKARLRDRLKRYEEFKAEKARRNYEDKLLKLRNALEEREKKLDGLYKQQLQEQRNFQTTEHVTKEYLGSLFPTETL